MQRGGARAGRAGRQDAWRRAGWVGRLRPRPEGPLAVWRQWVSRAPVASGEARLPCFSSAASLRASGVVSRLRRLQGSRGSPRRRSPPLPSARRVGNARRPLQAWCRWSALGSPRAAPPRGALVRPAKPAGAPTSLAAALRTARVTRTALPGVSGQSAAPPCAGTGAAGCADQGAYGAGACGPQLRGGGEPHRGFQENILFKVFFFFFFRFSLFGMFCSAEKPLPLFFLRLKFRWRTLEVP